MAKADIKLNSAGHGSLVIDGTDVSNVVVGFTLYAQPRSGAQLLLELSHLDITVEADIAVDLPEDVRAALLALGWQPPTMHDDTPKEG